MSRKNTEKKKKKTLLVPDFFLKKEVTTMLWHNFKKWLSVKSSYTCT